MHADSHRTPDPSTPDTPDPVTAHLDRDGLKGAHGRTGRMLQNAGLPFEEDEFEEAEHVDTDKLATGVDANEDADSSSSSSSDD
jgi:hypothetical protein